MKDILEEIVAWKRIEVAQQKEQLPPHRIYEEVEKAMSQSVLTNSMRNSLNDSPYGIIAEFKRKSPSKGWIHPDVNPIDVVPEYANNGASALSILTDKKYFGGDLNYIQQVREQVGIPILRKEFIIDEYQIFQARLAGADAILLIAADLSQKEVKTYTSVAHELQLEVLLEIHDERELDYAQIDVDMIGVNNRNLGTFQTDVENSFKMASLLPTSMTKVSESGISTPDVIRNLREVGYRGFLIGECFMKEQEPGVALKEFISKI